jgi:hypothetical protein
MRRDHLTIVIFENGFSNKDGKNFKKNYKYVILTYRLTVIQISYNLIIVR